jgi:NTP pyrophosphatase (non-canonical NTP hydrolase)
MVDTGKLNDVKSDWIPETDPVRLAIISKLQEECAELQKVLARCVAQGIDEVDPSTGLTNRQELEKELADVRAITNLLMNEEKLDIDLKRVDEKYRHKLQWIRNLADLIY